MSLNSNNSENYNNYEPPRTTNSNTNNNNNNNRPRSNKNLNKNIKSNKSHISNFSTPGHQPVRKSAISRQIGGIKASQPQEQSSMSNKLGCTLNLTRCEIKKNKCDCMVCCKNIYRHKAV